MSADRPDAAASAGYELVRVAGGAWSVRARAEGETFHPGIGPAAEAEAVYLRPLRLVERLHEAREPLVVWDVGLGAAANVLTLFRATRELTAPLRVVSFDRTLAALAFARAHAQALGYFAGYEAPVDQLNKTGEVHFPNGRQPVHWSVEVVDFPAWLAGPRAAAVPPPHAILYDAFSPARNPDMWTLPLFRQLHARLDPQRPCALATYSRATLVRVTLLLAGFYVGVGQASGEKEETTVAANDPALLAAPLNHRWLSRARRSSSAEPLAGPRYVQARLSAATLDRLERHPQWTGT